MLHKFKDDKNLNMKMVLVASFSEERDALAVAEILVQHEIPCSLRNYYSNLIMGKMVDVGGVRIEIPEIYVSRVEELVEKGELVLPGEEGLPTEQISRWLSWLLAPEHRKRKQTILTLLLFIILVILLFLLSLSK
jgi:hypothetical protein